MTEGGGCLVLEVLCPYTDSISCDVGILLVTSKLFQRKFLYNLLVL